MECTSGGRLSLGGGFYLDNVVEVKVEEVEKKVEVIVMDPEEEVNGLEEENGLPPGEEVDDEEATMELYNGGYHDDPLLDPLEISPSRQLRSTLASFYPFSLKIPRITRESPVKTPGRRKATFNHTTYEPLPEPPPPTFTLAEGETTIRTFIDNCLRSRKDPLCRHQFYYTIHRVLNEALHQNLIIPTDLDNLWKKYDDWASSSASYRLGDHYALQYRQRANDPDEDPPKPKKTSRQKKSHSKLCSVHPNRILRGMTRNLEESVKSFILTATAPLRDDLRSRIRFYETWQKYYTPGNELFLDFFWNALLNRTPDFYEGPSRKISKKVVLPPSPKKMKFDAPQPPPPPPKAVQLLPPPTYRPSPLLRPQAPCITKNLDMDRLVKLTINSCIQSGKDPKATHKFYWTVHRSLETVKSLNLSVPEIDAMWKKYDDWADQAYSTGTPFQVLKILQLYDDVSELPPPAKKVTPKRPPELALGYPEGLRQLLEKSVKGFIMSGNVTSNQIRDNLRKRRTFLEIYVHFMEPHWKDELIDDFWRKLLINTVHSYKNGVQITQKIPRPSEMPVPKTAHVPKKFDMDRLVKLTINSLIQSGSDPKACHKFYWTIHRSLETVSSLNLSPDDVDQLWRKYDTWADTAFLTRAAFKVDLTNHWEFYGDVGELPPPPVKPNRPPRPSCLNKPNGLRNWLERAVREFVMRQKSTVNTFRNDLAERRRFLASYVDYVPLDYRGDFVIDGYWRRLLRETIDDYKIYMELTEVVSQRMDEEVDTGSCLVKRFNMDYLVRRVIRDCVQSGVDPRSTHRFYWTLHRCLEESRRLNPGNRTTMGQTDAIWAQYDAMARNAFTENRVALLEEDATANYYTDVSELGPPQQSLAKVPSITQLFPNCPKSTALKKFLEQTLRQTVERSGMVTNQNNYLLNDVKARRKFFQDYLPYVEGMSGEAVDGVVGGFWKRLLTETRENHRKPNILTNGVKSSSQPTSSLSPTPSEKKVEEVPCYVID